MARLRLPRLQNNCGEQSRDFCESKSGARCISLKKETHKNNSLGDIILGRLARSLYRERLQCDNRIGCT